MTKSLYMTSSRSRAWRSATNCTSSRYECDQHDVGVAAPPELERLAGADGDDVHAARAQLLERRQDGLQQPVSAVLVVVASRSTPGEVAVLSGQQRPQGMSRIRERDGSS